MYMSNNKNVQMPQTCVQDIEDDEDQIYRRPFRRRTLSVGSRMSTASASSTARPLAATTPTTPVDYHNDNDDAWSQVRFVFEFI